MKSRKSINTTIPKSINGIYTPTLSYRCIEYKLNSRQDKTLYYEFLLHITLLLHIIFALHIIFCLDKSIHELLITFPYIAFTFIITLFSSFLFCFNHPFYHLTLFA